MSCPNQTALSVNVNKVALLRNTRHLGIPSVVKAASICLEAGAHGITVHPRPDERHIRHLDVMELAELLSSWPNREYNIEGNPFHNLMELIREVRPHQATFVPDSVSQSTSDHGWDLNSDFDRLRPLIQECRELGIRVSLFMDPLPEMIPKARSLGADRIELYTESWASAFKTQRQTEVLNQFAIAAQTATDCGLGVNAGHDLSLENLETFLSATKVVQEVSIGHALIAESLEMGYERTVKAYLACIAGAVDGTVT
jgi:pyridoxine 5-phosphate synthase